MGWCSLLKSSPLPATAVLGCHGTQRPGEVVPVQDGCCTQLPDCAAACRLTCRASTKACCTLWCSCSSSVRCRRLCPYSWRATPAQVAQDVVRKRACSPECTALFECSYCSAVHRQVLDLKQHRPAGWRRCPASDPAEPGPQQVCRQTPGWTLQCHLHWTCRVAAAVCCP